MAINYRDIVHPEDEKALRQLQNTPGVKFVAEKLVNLGYEKFYRNLCMANKIRLGPNQLPDIYNLLPPIAEKFGIEVPELYLEASPTMNAMTVGDQHPLIILYSGLVSSLSREELASVIAHECGHILCHHCLYTTVLDLLNDLTLRGSSKLGVLIPLPVIDAALYATCYWSRRAEYSADRASLLYTEDINVTNKALLRIHAGPISVTKDINLEEFAKQTQMEEKQTSDSLWDKMLYTLLVSGRDHPFATSRLAELRNWQKTAQYRMVIENIKNNTYAKTKKECPGCHREIDKSWKFCHNCGFQLQ